MNTRKRDGRSFWLRVSRWLRVSAWLPPGLAIAWLATLATLIRNTGIMIAVWAATVSLVLLVVLVTQLAEAARRRASAAEASAAKKVTANPASTGKSSTDAVSAEAGSTASGSAGTEVAVGQPAAPSAQHNAASTVDPVAGTARPSVATAPAPVATAPAPVATAPVPVATAPVPAVTAPVPAATTYPPLAAGPIVPDLLVLSAEEVASALRVELNLVIDSIDAGALPGNHLGDYWLIDQRALTRWLRGRYVDPPGRDQLRRSQASHRAPTAALSSLSAV